MATAKARTQRKADLRMLLKMNRKQNGQPMFPVIKKTPAQWPGQFVVVSGWQSKRQVTRGLLPVRVDGSESRRQYAASADTDSIGNGGQH